MADDDTFLDVMQADMVSVLKGIPALSDAVIIADDEGDLDSKVERSLASRKDSTTGKRGLVVVILRPEVVEAETNLPGPPMEIKAVVQTIEQVMYNRDPVKGTLKTASQAALNVLASLHLRSIGSRLLFARKNPISTLPVIQGHLSRGVTIYAKSDGLVSPRPGPVDAEMAALGDWGTLHVSGALMNGMEPSQPVTVPDLLYAGNYNGRPAWTQSGASPDLETGYMCRYDPENWGGWVIQDGMAIWAIYDTSDAPNPIGLEFAGKYLSGQSGQAVLTATAPDSALVLTCATPAAAIRYTTDGSFPSPSKTLYTAPISGLVAGTVVRACAWSADGPGDLLELTITE